MQIKFNANMLVCETRSHLITSAWYVHLNRMQVSKENNSETLFIICVSMIELSRLTVTLLMHLRITFLIILPLLPPQLHSHMYVIKLISKLLTFHLKILKYTPGLYLDQQVFLDKSPIPGVEETKFLGIIFNRRLPFVPHLKYFKKKDLKALNILKVIGNTEWGAD